MNFVYSWRCGFRQLVIESSMAGSSSDLPPYLDNTALLYHCCKGDLHDRNFTMGLDDRLAKEGSDLGRGIYFAENPSEAMLYAGEQEILMIFAVALGDCLDFGKQSNGFQDSFKKEHQKRNHLDLSFDSIVGRPNSRNRNEYVIFDRRRCYPMYAVTYSSAAGHGPMEGGVRLNPQYARWYDILPPFSWTPNEQLGAGAAQPPKQTEQDTWPFLATNVFRRIKTEKPDKPTGRVHNVGICGFHKTNKSLKRFSNRMGCVFGDLFNNCHARKRTSTQGRSDRRRLNQ